MERRNAIAIDVVEQSSCNLTLVTHILHSTSSGAASARKKVRQSKLLEKLESLLGGKRLLRLLLLLLLRLRLLIL